MTRTTVTLEPDTELLLRKRMRERGITFKQAVNEAIVIGLTTGEGRPRFQTRTFDTGVPIVDLTKANQLAAELEDAHILEAMALAERDAAKR